MPFFTGADDTGRFQRRVVNVGLRDQSLETYFERGYVTKDEVFAAFKERDALSLASALPSYGVYAEQRDAATRVLEHIGEAAKPRWPAATALGSICVLLWMTVAGFGHSDGAIWAATTFFMIVMAAGIILFVSAGFDGVAATGYRLAPLLLLALAAPFIPQIVMHESRPFWTFFTLGATTLLIIPMIRRMTQDQVTDTFALFFWIPQYLIRTRVAAELQEKWLSESVDAVILPELFQAINDLLGDESGKLFAAGDTDELRRLHDLDLLVPTRSERHLQNTLSRVDGASVAISGPRGVGKSTLLRSLTENGDYFAFSVSAPADYVPKEFLVELFQRLCERYIIYQGHTYTSRKLGRRRRWFPRIRLAGALRIALAVLLAGLLAWSLSGYVVPVVDRTIDFALDAAGAAGGFARDVWDGYRWQCQTVLAFIAFKVWPKRRSWRLRGGVEPALVSKARGYLLQLQVEHTKTWGAGASVPVLQGGAFTRGGQLKYLPWTMPELVGHLRRFLTEIAQDEAGRGRPVIVGIDEVDRISSLEQAERFVSEIKAIFGVDNCFFLVSVADEVTSIFARRAIAGRSMFDNAFDEIVTMEPLAIEEARDLLQKRVLGLTDPFVYLIYTVSGGIPRELLRVTRRLVETNAENEGRLRLTDLADALVRKELSEATAGIRGSLARLNLPTEWGRVFHLTRRAMDGLEPDADPTALRVALTQLATLAEAALPCGDGEHETAARKAITDLAALAYYGLSVAEAFTDATFDIRAVRDTPLSAHGSYTELATARRELNFSCSSARQTLDEFRQYLSLTIISPARLRNVSAEPA
jgi:hypothetical protein